MRGLWIIVVLVACHHADAPAPAAPKGPTACARASDNMVRAMLDRLANNAPPTEEADALRNLIRERCEKDGWSQEATSCLIAMKRLEDADACAKLMTDEQQAALVRDEDARFGAAPGDGGHAPSPGASAPAHNEAPGPAGAAAPAPEPAHNAAPAADPAAAPAARVAPAAVAPTLQPAAAPPPGRAPKAPAKPAKAKGNKAAGDPCSGGE